MLKNQDIICFAPSDWWGMNPSCTTHLMKQFALTNRVVYINPFSSDILGCVGSTGNRRGLFTRILRKLKSLVKIYSPVSPGMHVISPFFLPFQGVSWIDKINDMLVTLQLKVICRMLKIRCPIIWIENLRAAGVFEHFKSGCIVHHVSDLFSDDSYANNQTALKRRESRVLAMSDMVICVSQSLYERLKERHPHVQYIPHGVDYDLFEKAVHDNHQMEELKSVSRPIVGYFGTLTAHNDIELLEYCAEHIPQASFVFAGLISGGNYDLLKRLPNVYFLGKLPYEKIPALCAGLDVGLLPWIVDDWIRNCNPLKMFEYMACGKPIVSVMIREAEKYPGHVCVTHSKEEFCEAIKNAFAQNTPQLISRRMEIAKSHSWQFHREQIGEMIEQVLRQKKVL